MKELFVLISLFYFVTTFSQVQNGTPKIFRTTEYIYGIYYREVYDTIDLKNEKMDVYFFKKHFDQPYYLPLHFINKSYRNKTIKIWRYNKSKKDQRSISSNTYTYDRLSRVTRFTYSACFTCSDLNYDYYVTYNSFNQISKLSNTINWEDTYHFHYNGKRILIQMDHYKFDKLSSITVLLD